MIWLDTETRSVADVTKVGAYQMSRCPKLRFISVHWAFDDGPAEHWRGLFADGVTPETKDKPPFELWDRIASGEEVTAWNAAFERLTWNAIARRTPTMPEIKLVNLDDAATLARAHNLPASLKNASVRVLPPEFHKLVNTAYHPLWRDEGDVDPALAQLFKEMLAYGDMDVIAMREIVKRLIPFDDTLREDYVVSEEINDRGLCVDRDWAASAVAMREHIEKEAGDLLEVLTARPCESCGATGRVDGAKPASRKCPDCDGKGETAARSAGQSSHLREWAIAMMGEAGIKVLEPKEEDEPGDNLRLQANKKKLNEEGTGYVTTSRRSFDKNVRANLREWLEERAQPIPGTQHYVDTVIEVLDLLEQTTGTAAVKYAAALGRSDEDGILQGMYILNGASQTGRFASTGMQTHNLIRKVMADPDGVMEALQGVEPEAAATLCTQTWKLPLNAVLGRLLRPTIIPRVEGNCMGWADWSGIEARVCPWLADDPQADRLLNQFRNGEDVYIYAAQDIVGHPVGKDDPERQLGKVAVLSLGFGGAVGAYTAMAKNYGMGGMPTDRVREIVYAWREANPWAQDWWRRLQSAAFNAVNHPGEEFEAGRVTFAFLPGLLDGTLVMFLPDGRPLFYTGIIEKMASRFEGEPPEPVLTFMHPVFGRSPIWYGQLAENATQATAASLLRRSLRTLAVTPMPGQIVGHTHDEIIAEAPLRAYREQLEIMERVMLDVPDWAPGLPLAVESKAGWSYYAPFKSGA